MNDNIRILIVEDDPLIAAEIADCLDELDYSVSGKAADRAAAIQQLERNPPDAVLLDINLEGGAEGIELADIINRRYRLPIIFLTSYADKGTLDAAKKTEPAGYIVKPFTEKDLLAGLEIALYNFSQKLHRAAPPLQLDKLNRALPTALTRREFELLVMLKEGRTNRQMAERLFVSANTVKTHLKNLFLKLDVASRTAAVARAGEVIEQ
jgi:DNA-binding NarL/FixJ family response regulator